MKSIKNNDKNMKATAENILDTFVKVKNTDNILLVKDEKDNIFTKLFAEVLKDRGLLFKEVLITKNRPSSSPIPEILKELMWADVVIAPTIKSITHSPEVRKAEKKGTRTVTMPGMTKDVFLKINKVNFSEIYKLSEKVLKQVEDKDKILIESKNGTNISFSIKNRLWEGYRFKKGEGFTKNLPIGEVFCAPIENSANGIIFIERWKNYIKPKNKAWIRIENGKIVEWNIGAEPYINNQSVDNGLIIGEFGIGLNKEHKLLIGNTLHDEKIYGSVHVAFGNNISFGGKNKSTVHEDLIIMNPEVLIDGKKLKFS